MVVFAAEQVEVPDLGLGRHEQLDCTRQQHFGIVFAQCAVIGRIDLIVHVLCAVQILDITAAGDNGFNQTLDALVRDQTLEVKQRDTVMTAQHVDDLEVLVQNFLCPVLEILAVAGLQRIDQQAGEEEVVGHIALAAHGLLNSLAVAGVNFGQKGQTVFVRQTTDALQNVPGAGLV